MPAAKTWFIDIVDDSLRIFYTSGGEMRRARGKAFGAIRDIRPGGEYAKEGTTEEQKQSLIMVRMQI